MPFWAWCHLITGMERISDDWDRIPKVHGKGKVNGEKRFFLLIIFKILYIHHHCVFLWLDSLTVNITEVCVCCGTLLLSKSLKTLILPSDLFCKEAAAYHTAATTSKRAMGTYNFPELSPVEPHCWQTKSYWLIFFFPHDTQHEKIFGAIQSPFHVPLIRVQNPGKCMH